MRSTLLNSQTPRSSVARTIASFRSGSVTRVNACQREAPSTAAASYRSGGIACSAASSTIAKNGTPRQSSAATTDANTVFTSASHWIGLWITPTRVSTVSSRPVNGLYMSFHIVVTTTPDTAHGENSSERASPRPLKALLRTSASAMPSTSCSTTSLPTHFAETTRLVRNTASAVSTCRKLSRSTNPFRYGRVTSYCCRL